MKKKILIGCAAAVVLIIAALYFAESSRRVIRDVIHQTRKTASPGLTADAEETAGYSLPELKSAAATGRTSDAPGRPETQGAVIAMGPVYKPADVTGRRLEYQADLNYQINDLKTARAFFNQWIPRYGFMHSEAASGHGDGYLTLTVKVRSANLYAALSELDAIGTLANERIAVVDHTENSVYQQMLAEREQIRLRRRVAAAGQNGAASRNWQAAETLLAASEDKELQTRMEEWRIGDRVQWATVTIQLTTPVVVRTAAVEMPAFQNAFIGVLNLLLQLLYAGIYLTPLVLLTWLVWRVSLRALPLLRKTLYHGLKPVA